MDRLKVSIIIVNFNGGELLTECVRSALASTIPVEVFVSDNGSSDGSIQYLRQNVRDDRLTIIMNDENLGFAGGNNYAFNLVDTEFVVLLNPDAFPEPDWLENLLVAANKYPEVVAFGSRQMVCGQAGVVDGLGDVYHLSGLVWRQGYGQELDDKKMISGDIFSPCAGAALYRTKAVKEVGGFDDDFFCYVEDVDLGFRLRLAGYKSMYVSNAVVYHVGSAITGKKSDFSIYHGHRNLVWVFVKNMPGILFWVLLPIHLFMNLGSVFYFLFKGKGKVILHAKWDALRGVPKMWKKRRVIQDKRVASIIQIWRILDKRIISF